MNPVDTLMKKAIEDGVFPSGALLFSRADEVLHHRVYTAATIFDVASLTKVLSTTAIVMKLVEEGSLRLDQTLLPQVPEFEGTPYEALTVHDLLAHRSGLPAYKPYFNESKDIYKSISYNEITSQYLRLIASEAMQAMTGDKRIYSDLGFIALGIFIERLTKKRLRGLFEEKIKGPLGLKETAFSPLDVSDPKHVAETGDDPWRGKTVCGEVHDENAHVLGGAAGHAGIFTSLADCHIFAREIVRSVHGQSSWLKRETAQIFLNPVDGFVLGWDIPTQPGSQAGHYFSSQTVGHLGFTGCSLWIDLEEQIIAVLLTNRVHPTRTNEQIKEFRPKIHDLLFRHYLGS
jgi:serine-type D-Ala-D-Ala carboxypeptidase